MPWIQRISRLSQTEKEGLYRILIPPTLYQRFGIDPLSLCNADGKRVVRFFCPQEDRTCLVEILLPGAEDPLYSLQLSDTIDITQIELDFVIANDPDSPKFNTHIDKEGRDTLFGWASRNLSEEMRAFAAGLFPGQVQKGLGLSRQVIYVMDFFCRMLEIKSIELEALFYHNAITYERLGFAYRTGYKQMKRIHEQFQPGGALYEKMDAGTPFRNREQAQTVRGRSWAIHDGILQEIDDDLLRDGWESPAMYRMVEKPRAMVTFPDPTY
ncbi:MAG: hypothetical protein ACOWYE_16050 [Desulfatiglandales bacterium]